MVNSLQKSSVTNADLSRPVFDAHGLSTERYESRGSSVDGLQMLVGPSAVAWGVTPFIVDSVDSRIDWSLSHISDEVFEFHPSLAHLDTGSAIQPKKLAVLICASVDDGSPGFVCAGPGAPLRVTMLGRPVGRCFGNQTTTGPRIPGSQVFTKNFPDGSACTNAFPDWLPMLSVADESHYGKPSEFHSSHVFH